jgi:hypothetical protein
MLKKYLNSTNWDNYLRSTENVDKKFYEIINTFLKPDIIDVNKFFENYRLISQPEEFFYCPPVAEEPIKHTPTMPFFTNFMHRPLGFPEWFFAAYPDIVYWISFNLEKFESEKRITELLDSLDHSVNSYIPNTILRMIVDYYKKNVQKYLECGFNYSS